MVRADAAKLEYELMTLNDRYLVAFTDRRLEDSTIPEGLFCYDIRYEADSKPKLPGGCKPSYLGRWQGCGLVCVSSGEGRLCGTF